MLAPERAVVGNGGMNTSQHPARMRRRATFGS
jgi:hypothetical protein